MTVSAVLQYSLPALLAGALGGYFASGALEKAPKSSERPASTLRSEFLSTSDDEIDYEKLARVCLAAGSRSLNRTSAKASILAEPNSPKVLIVKEQLDELMSRAMEAGKWTRGAGAVTEGLLHRLPPSDVADFENLLRTTVERGDLQVQPGAWLPENLK
jgi:hypothetical protein